MKTDLVVAGYIFHDNKVLLIHHKKLKLWLPVGGHIDENETPDDALLREIKEETGLDVEIINQSNLGIAGNTIRNLALPFHVNVHSVGDHNHCCFFYVCKTKNSQMIKLNKEINNYKWFSREDLSESRVPSDVRSIALNGFKIIERP